MKTAFFRLLPALTLTMTAIPAVHADNAVPTTPVAAATTDSALPITTTVTVASQYVSRGIRQTWGRPALQVGVDYVRPDGWSAGTWASTISDRFVEGGKVEWDLYGGYSGTAGAFGYSLMAYYYLYPGAAISATDTKFNYGELSAGATWKSFYAKYNYTFTRDFFGIVDARGTGYLDVGMNHDLGGGYVLNLHAGDGRVAGAGNDYWNWRDAKAGVTRSFDGGWTVAAAWTRAWGKTDAYERYTTGVPRADGMLAVSNPAKATLVVSVAKTF